MAGPKDKDAQDKDAIASFFGDDDFDWMDDEEEEEEEAAPAAEASPAPEPAAEVPAEPEPEAPAEPEVSAAPEPESEVSAAPEPPEMSAEPEPDTPADPVEPSAAAETPSDEDDDPFDFSFGFDETPAPGPAVGEGAVPSAPPPPPPTPTTPAAAADDEDEDGDDLAAAPEAFTPSPLDAALASPPTLGTPPAEPAPPPEPGPAAADDDAPAIAPLGEVMVDVAPALGTTPPVEGVAGSELDVRPETGTGDAPTWATVVQSLEREASADGVEPPTAQALRLAAAEVRWHALGDAEGARAILEAQPAEAVDEARHLTLAAGTAAALGDTAEVEASLTALGASLEGVAGGEMWRRAAALAAAQPDRAETALAYLDQAVQADPDDLAARLRIRALAESSGRTDKALSALSGLAERLDAEAAAQTHLERAHRLDEADRSDDALAAARAARAADPLSPAPFLDLWRRAARRGDDPSLAELFEAEAEASEGADAAWWWLSAARARRRAGDDATAAQDYGRAVEHGSSFALAEQQGWLSGASLPEARAEALEAEIARYEDPSEAATAWVRLALLHEAVIGQHEAATKAWAAAAEAGVPLATRALVRRLRAAGDDATLVARLQALEAPRPGWAELELALAEERAGEAEAAAARLADLATRDDAPFGTFEAWVRVARGTGDTEALRGALAHALGRVGPQRAGALAIEAASLQAHGGGALGEALELLDGIRTVGIDLGAELRIAWSLAEGRTEAALQEIEALAAEDPAAWVRAGRLRWDLTGDAEGAAACADRALEALPDDLGALTLLADVLGPARADAWAPRLAKLAQGTGDEASWAAFTAVALAEARGDDVASVRQPSWASHAGIDHLLAVAASGSADAQTRATRLEEAGLDDVERLLTWADLRFSADPEEVQRRLRAAPAPTRAHRAAARHAWALGAPEVAWRWLSGCDGARAALDRAGLVARDPTRAAGTPLAEVLAPALDDDALRPRSQRTLARQTLEDSDDASARAEALSTLAEATEVPAVRFLRALQAGQQLAGLDRHDEALAAFQSALAVRPGSELARQGARTAAKAVGDVEALQALYADDPLGRARALSEAGAEPDTTDPAWEHAVEEQGLVARLHHEVALYQADRYQALFDAWTARLPDTRSPEEASALEARRRWVLAEHLAETEAAWDLYRHLHDDAPEDREVLENLARIAGARGEDELATRYLAQLAESAASPEDSARYQRRIAEVHLHQERHDEARQALFDALDFKPDDREALAALAELASRSGDWQEQLSVLKREASIALAEERPELLRRVATLTGEHADDDALTIDAWRAVIQAVPGDVEALEHLLELADANEDHDMFLEIGGHLESLLEGAERASVLRRLGLSAEALGRREDAIHAFEQAVGMEEPDVEAAERLAGIYRDANDWSGVVRALLVQGRHLDDTDARLERYLEAAHLELELRHDRDAAAAIFEEILTVDPDRTEALTFQVSYLYDLGRYDDALPLCERLEPQLAADADEEDDFDARMERSGFYFQFAEMLKGAGRDAEALSRYEAALELNNTHLPTLQAIGPLYVDAGRWKDAAEVFQRVLQLTGGQGEPKKVAETYTYLGRVEHELGNLEKAYRRYNKALETFPNHVPALKGLAMILESRGHWKSLLKGYNSIIYHATLPADVIDAYMTKGRILDAELDRPDKARQHYERSLSFQGDQPAAFLRLAELSLREAAWEDALGQAERGLGVAGSDHAVAGLLLLARAIARAALEDEDGAADALGRARDMHPPLAEVLPEDPLSDTAALATLLREQLPT